MQTILKTLLVIGVLIFNLTIASVARAQLSHPSKSGNAYANLPMRFEENLGQSDSQVQFISRGPDYMLFLTAGEAVLKLSAQTATAQLQGSRHPLTRDRAPIVAIKSSVLRMRLEGARGTPTITGVDKLPGDSNYFIGKDPGNWRRGVRSYAKVLYTEIYPGIDLEFYGNRHQLEYDFIVSPGTDSKQISLAFDGASGMSVDPPTGDVAIETAVGNMALRKPVIYQMENGQKVSVKGSYNLSGNGQVAFDLGDYNHGEPLVIDPVLAYSTYLDGSSSTLIMGLAVDSAGCAYVAGFTDSTDFPIVGTSISSPPTTISPGGYMGFVSKLSSDGTALIYSDYIGGSSRAEFPYSIAVDTNGYAYAAGNTGSEDFPITSNAYQTELLSNPPGTYSAFLSKISSDGQSLLYSTYFGSDGYNQVGGVAVDGAQNAYIVGMASPGSVATVATFPTTSTAIQTAFGGSGTSLSGNAFLARIDTTQSGTDSLIYSTLLGGSGGDLGYGIAIDENQNAFIVGMTCSQDFPLTESTAYQTANPNCTSFLTQIDTTQFGRAGLIYSTLFGGTSSYCGAADSITSVALDVDHKVYVAGQTDCPDFPSTTGVTYSPDNREYVAKFDTSQSGSNALLYSTLITGSDDFCEWVCAVAVDANGNAYVGGRTNSSSLPVTPDAIQGTLGTSGYNPFLVVFSPDASTILYGTYLGGSGGGDDILCCVGLDQGNNIYMAGATGSADFQTTTGSLQTNIQGTSYNGFITELTALPVPNIASLSRVSGLDGTAITINGLNFGASQGSSNVMFGANRAPIVSWSEKTILTQVPGFAPSGLDQVTVNTPLEPSNSEPFMVTASPIISTPVIVGPGKVKSSNHRQKHRRKNK